MDNQRGTAQKRTAEEEKIKERVKHILEERNSTTNICGRVPFFVMRLVCDTVCSVFRCIVNKYIKTLLIRNIFIHLCSVEIIAVIC